MVISQIQPIIDGLNKKKYAQHTMDDQTYLTEEEKNVILTYRPEQSLVIYGTLAPGRPNHSVIEPIKGVWQKGTIRGRLENKGWGAELGYYGFLSTHGPEQVEIAVHVLFSKELVIHWAMLDAFEGPGYQRILVPFVLENGVVGVGNIYALQEESSE